MKYILIVILIVFFITPLQFSCTHQSYRLIDKMAGTRLWHGTNAWNEYPTHTSGIDTIKNEPHTITVISDSTFSFDGNEIFKLNSIINGELIFEIISVPVGTKIIYFSNNNSMEYHYSWGGNHYQDIELYTL